MSELFGHDQTVKTLYHAEKSGRLHHAWLLAGPRGIGKRLWADKVAAWLLASAVNSDFRKNAPVNNIAVPDHHPTLSLIKAGSHPDLLRLERLFRDSKEQERARNITVDQVRGIQRLFSTTPALSFRRIVIIDSIDDLERAAANALLKNLEEPPAGTIFLLISHAVTRLLPTIRSRCRILRFQALDDSDVLKALRQNLPEANEEELVSLVKISQGAPGYGLKFSGLDIATLDRSMNDLIKKGDSDLSLRSQLAQSLALKSAQGRYEAFLEQAPARIAAEAHHLTGERLARAIHLWEKARQLANEAISLSLDPQATVFTLAGLLARLAPTDRFGKR
ncbi:MAG: DNA polymerase III subunit delta' [Zymomonas mobilis subsp. pomaceae]|uniref:DNA-directed DNA polymerase n=1 Tax=Zymomonas mobilis subsp. pomaceae (strain ATCC 29192 / DSM 22645 / JCM 10191 / CCUG 17912 / NBRC 13757 / NCIMB 11200 / NRRL B-4491 / Barker I) TaxID=579138 RepID=F8EU21_ZYMMT|nr:DNA polymerase III subunit delta' [Zymomonas mobilis]AEI37101.1 DNA-directed DNA polymerase [Zymomonas mobilis subsp. pomaceae ATCC 29192]MDX5948472.1 DNA polymerase III subunit delta' [Zymomonas mobilis subsp. pomaceae]GEB89463.1 DNA polymerase III subunit delta' [Zymomonas mobilis subsp. pomaceae]